jgi:hypothetical protein
MQHAECQLLMNNPGLSVRLFISSTRTDMSAPPSQAHHIRPAGTSVQEGARVVLVEPVHKAGVWVLYGTAANALGFVISSGATGTLRTVLRNFTLDL